LTFFLEKYDKMVVIGDSMKTGIIILNYNDAENTKKMLLQIKNYHCFSSVVVVDNCSTDDSLQELLEYQNDKVVLLELKENKGYSSGNNAGLEYLEKNTDCELVIISNPDVLVEEKVIDGLIHDMKQHPEISFLGPTILEYGSRIQGWKLPTYFVEVLSTINFFHRFAKRYQWYDTSYYKNTLMPVEVIHGSFFLARLKDFQKIGYFDPNTFLYYEENILGKKAQIKKMSIFVDTSLSVTHMLSQSVDKSFKKIKKYKIMKESMFYYERTYNDLKGIKYYFLKFLYFCSLIVSYFTFWI